MKKNGKEDIGYDNMSKITYQFRLLISELLLYSILIIAPDKNEGEKLKKIIFKYAEEKLVMIKEK